MRVPLDESIKNVTDLPYTYSFVIRKRGQIDGINELPKEKRPPEHMLWDGGPEDIEAWLEKVFGAKEKQDVDVIIDTSILED